MDENPRWISRNPPKTKSPILNLIDFEVNRQGTVFLKHKSFNGDFIDYLKLIKKYK